MFPFDLSGHLPWRESEDLPRIERRREPPEAGECSDAVEADSR
jgi:hypothetical protein